MRFAILGSLLVAFPVAAAAPEIRVIDPDATTGRARAVVVGPALLGHTTQLLPLNRFGEVVGKGDAARQVEQVLDNLAAVAELGQSSFDRIVKVNVYVARRDVVPAVEKAFARRFVGPVRPAVSVVETPLPHPDALVAVDAVTAAKAERGTRLPMSADRAYRDEGGHPIDAYHGPRVYVAGQAEKGVDLPEATRKTLTSLRDTLKHLDVPQSAVLQLKCFLSPMTDVAKVQGELKAFYGSVRMPPVVFVEWKSPLIEIELVAAAARVEGRPPVEFLTPPGMTASPIYSRVCRVNADTTIYVSGLYGPEGDGEKQVLGIFDELSGILKKAGSDFQHLAKATYYVSDDDASRKLNELRPRFYDPKRPPSASKAAVAGVGREKRSLTLDMIAVPAP